MPRSPEGPPPPPVVQKLRMRYAKRGRLRFTSHRDFQRALERALRRAAVPMAYSAGFTPHPKISYANSAATGVASEAEYLELGLATRCEPEQLRRELDASLPAGLDVLELVEAGPGGLADRLVASVYLLRVAGIDQEAVEAAVAAFLASAEVTVQRQTKSGLRTFDARGAVIQLTVHRPDELPVLGNARDKGNENASDGVADALAAGPCAILRLVVRHTTPAVRPDDVLTGLRQVADLAPPSPSLVTRLAQGLLDAETGEVTDPLAPDLGVATAAVTASSTADEEPT